MSYRLTYAWNGHEICRNFATLDDVNARIRKLYDEHGSIAILRVEEHHNGPRTWRIEYPPAPPAGTRVRDTHGTIRTVGEEGTLRFKGEVYSWKGALNEIGPVTEVVETEVEAAARRLREADFVENFSLRGWYVDDIRTVLAHVLNGGQL